MEDFSQFITEEIFLIDDSEKGRAPEQTPPASKDEIKEKVAEPLATYQPEQVAELGVVNNSQDPEDQKLLNAILGAIKADVEAVKKNDQADASAKKWMDFTAGQIGIAETENGIIISSYSLEELRNSTEQKGKLWAILKSHFDI